MSKQNIWLTVLVLVLVILAVGYFYWPKKAVIPKEQEFSKEKAGVENLQRAIEKTNTVAVPEVPSANPLQKVAPVKNPLEVTNPFNDGYQNPFK